LTVLAILVPLALTAVQVSSSFLEYVQFSYPALSGAHFAIVIPARLVSFLETGPEFHESAENEAPSVTFDGFVCKTVPEKYYVRKPYRDPWPVLDIWEVSCVEVDDMVPNYRIVDSAPGITDERVGEVCVEEVP
jgi:hypothetical protein